MKFISWHNVNQCNDIVREFNLLAGCGFPNIIGAVDGTHVLIDPPYGKPKCLLQQEKIPLHNFAGCMQT